jgi:uncharacterized protein YegP (UPF0339 family)
MVNESKFEYYQDTGKNNEWRWRFKASNSKIIAMSSEGYTNEDDCKHSIDLIKKESPYALIYKVLQ